MYIVFEIQTNADGTVGTLTSTYANKSEAESKYHLVLSAAAVSSLPSHACVLMTQDGGFEKAECYVHDIQEVSE